ncbi:FAD:protein FMN transferase [Kribbella qitaiheensis]|uniref:FAD:protein FMN transferase n=1 Tax=Kribbella qitaiheensis TaxID=1544730 RepID=UPI0019D555B4|nr:FAD:protein FMN transferase [Kribbella qitaiheensis]
MSRRSWVEQVMGLPVSVLARGASAGSAAADAAVRAVYAELREVDRVFSPYRDDSEVSRLGRGELGWADATPLVREVAGRCLRAAELTGGLFDATRPDGNWDPSGLVKGWATERAARLLTAVGELDWCLNAGGDVVVNCPSGEPFVVGIQDPLDPAAVKTSVAVSAGAVATSGTTARGAHLYDPRTGRAVTGRRLSITVVGPSLELADVLATAAFVSGDDWTDFLDRIAAYEGLCIAPDGTWRTTAGWPR